MKKKRVLEDYMKAYGGTLEIPSIQNKSIMDNPQELFAQNNINWIKAKNQVSQNPLLQTGKMFAGVLKNAGASLISSQVGPLGDELLNTGLQGLDIYNASQNTPQFAMGGKVTVEVEGNEVAETPNGEFLEFNGASHEEGGIDVNLPVGTNIYSDRISIDGKTMSERKKNREKLVNKISKLLENKKEDKLLKNSLERTIILNKLEEQQDKAIQTSIRNIKQGNSIKAAYGGKLMAGYGFEGIGPGDLSEFTDYMNTINPKFLIPFIKNPDIAKIKDSPLTLDNTSFFDNKDKINFDTSQSTLKFSPQNLNKISDTSTEKDTTNSTNKLTNLKLGLENSLGLAGELIQGFGPLFNTMNNRAGDTPNINFHKNYGLNALKTNDDNLALIDQETDLNKRDLQLARNAQVNRMRNSARSINTLRALDLASDQELNKNLNNVYANKIKAVSANNNIKAQLQNQRDEVTMNAEDKRDERDRQDRDNYYTQHASDLNQLGMHIAGIGKNFNIARDNSEAVNLVNTLSKYGLTIDDLKKVKKKR